MADDRDRNEHGQYADRLDPEIILEILDDHNDLARPITTGDVVEALDVSQGTALNKLNELVSAGGLDSRTVGARARVFWRPIDDPDEHLKRLSRKLGTAVTVGATTYEDGDTYPADHDVDDQESESESAPESDVSAPESGADALDALGLDEQQTAAVAAMRDYLREHGEAQKSDFQRDIYPEHPAGYDGEDGWWNALGIGGTTAESKGALADLPNVEKPGRGAKWRWAGDS